MGKQYKDNRPKGECPANFIRVKKLTPAKKKAIDKINALTGYTLVEA